MQLEQLYLSFNEISARTVIEMARNLKGLIFLDVFGLKWWIVTSGNKGVNS
jgi:DNA primase